MIDGVADGYASYEETIAAQPAEPLADRIAGSRHALQLGHHGPSQGRQAAAAEPAARRGRVVRVRPHGAAVRAHRGLDVPVAGAALPRCSAALLHGRPHGRRHRRGDGAVRPEDALRLIEQHRITCSQWVPTMFIRMLKLARRRPGQVRRVVAGGRRPRRRAVPGRGQEADDRVVGPGPARVLRRHRGQRLRLLQLRGLARPPRAPSARRSSARSTSSTTTATSCPSARPAPSTSRARPRPRSSTTTTPRRPRARATPRDAAGARSATSAASTRTASST